MDAKNLLYFAKQLYPSWDTIDFGFVPFVAFLWVPSPGRGFVLFMILLRAIFIPFSAWCVFEGVC